MRQKIQLTDTAMDVMQTMSEGNPGALSVLMMMLQADPKNLMVILSLDDMNIRGTQIWVGYKDYCGAMRNGDDSPPTEDECLRRFLKAIDDRDPKMVEAINNECIYDNQYGSFKESAVTHGGSWNHARL